MLAPIGNASFGIKSLRMQKRYSLPIFGKPTFPSSKSPVMDDIDDTFEVSETPTTPSSPTEKKLSFPDFMNNNNNICFSNSSCTNDNGCCNSRFPSHSSETESNSPDTNMESNGDSGSFCLKINNVKSKVEPNDEMVGPALSTSPTPKHSHHRHHHHSKLEKSSSRDQQCNSLHDHGSSKAHKHKRDRKPSPYRTTTMNLSPTVASPRKTSLDISTKSTSIDYSQYNLKREWPKFLKQQSATNQRLASIVNSHKNLRRKGSCPKISSFLSLSAEADSSVTDDGFGIEEKQQSSSRIKTTSSIPLSKDRHLTVNTILTGVLQKFKTTGL